MARRVGGRHVEMLVLFLTNALLDDYSFYLRFQRFLGRLGGLQAPFDREETSNLETLEVRRQRAQCQEDGDEERRVRRPERAADIDEPRCFGKLIFANPETSYPLRSGS